MPNQSKHFVRYISEFLFPTRRRRTVGVRLYKCAMVRSEPSRCRVGPEHSVSGGQPPREGVGITVLPKRGQKRVWGERRTEAAGLEANERL
ncbi:MAG: hypothetical protein AB1510_12930 [Bacillota bacterium]